MSCFYPSCMMGGGCPYEIQCDDEAEKARLNAEEKEKLDLEEQRLRIKKLKQEVGEEE